MRMFAYSSVSPYYLDYIATAKTRQEILDDPQLCHFLEDPVMKDNMEMALKYKSAKTGGYEEKKEFVEYFLCNGPELDTDTIMYYREKCMIDPSYMEIADIEFSDFETIIQLRETKYDKKSGIGDCFTQPCNYLGPFSNTIGMIGSSNNFFTTSNWFAKWKEDKKQKRENSPSFLAAAANGISNVISEATGDKSTEGSAWGRIRQHMSTRILPKIRVGCQVLYNSCLKGAQDFFDRCEKSKILDKVDLGAPAAIDRAELLSAATKLNTYNLMGNCARVWQQMRQFNVYDPNQNTKGPMGQSAIVGGKNTNGVAIDNTAATSPLKMAPPSVVSKAAANPKSGQMDVAQALKAVTTLNANLTQKDADLLVSVDINRPEASEKLISVRNKLNPQFPSYEEALPNEMKQLNAATESLKSPEEKAAEERQQAVDATLAYAKAWEDYQDQSSNKFIQEAMDPRTRQLDKERMLTRHIKKMYAPNDGKVVYRDKPVMAADIINKKDTSTKENKSVLQQAADNKVEVVNESNYGSDDFMDSTGLGAD